MQKNIYFLLLSFFMIISAGAAEFNCHQGLDDLPVLANGREKPLYIHAKDSMKFITGEVSPTKVGPTIPFCRLSLSSLGLTKIPILETRIDHVKVKELFDMEPREKSITIQKLIGLKTTLESHIRREKRQSSYTKEMNKLVQKIKLYQEIRNGLSWRVPNLNDKEASFVSILEFYNNNKELQQGLVESKSRYESKNGTAYLVELKYFKWNLYMWSLLASLFSIIFFIVFKSKTPGFFVFLLSLGLQSTALLMRTYISGRAPVTNMYETVVFGGFGALLLAGILYLYRRNSAFMISGLSLNILSLMMAKFANNMLDSTITPLMPVLRDNFWLSTHVTTTILSYSAFAISWILANKLLIKSMLRPTTGKEYRDQISLIYSSLKYGVVLLALGIILGAVWADYSWGRFWGWDPKETWSLISFLLYMAILHARYTNLLTPKRFAIATTLAFMSIMMTWFGVNYILATGLHSYGFSEGGAIFLSSLLLGQLAIITGSAFNFSKMSKYINSKERVNHD